MRLPGLRQRILLLEVRVEGRVSELLQAGRVVGRSILRSRDVGGGVKVAVEPLVVARQLAQVGSRAGRRNSPFSYPRDGGSVVAEIFNAGVANVVAVSHDVNLSQQGRLL